MTAFNIGVPNRCTVNQHFAFVAQSKSSLVYLNAFHLLVESASELPIAQVWHATMQLQQPLSDETCWIKENI